MAKKSSISKTQAVRDYLKAHPEAVSSVIAAALTKQGIKINAGYVANIKTKENKLRTVKKAAKKKAVVEAASPAVVEKPTTNGGTITLDQVKMVAHTIKSLGGFERVTEVLEVIKEMGGVKKFRDLAEAMTIPATATDAIPY
jgi:hypothetical protein